MDIKDVASRALSQAESLVSSWLPGGKKQGSEWVCGDLSGAPGGSLKVNLRTGKWADFAANTRGGDLVALYAAINNIGQKEAAEKLVHEVGGVVKNAPLPAVTKLKLIPTTERPLKALLAHREHGAPSVYWEYKTADNKTAFFVLRYDYVDQDGKPQKDMLPLSFTDDGRWVKKGWPAPRPLYDLPTVIVSKNVLIVEGEKAAEAAKKFINPKTYAVTTWPNGSKAWDKADWSVLYGKNVLIWPDHDEPGRQAAAKIGAHLLTHCPDIKIIDTSKDQYPDGWDAADSNFTWDEFKSWAKTRAIKVEIPPQEQSIDEPPMPSEVDAPQDTPLVSEPGGGNYGVFCLGFYEQYYFYTSTVNKFIVRLSASNHQKNELLNLMPLQYWRSRYPKSGKTSDGVDWTQAIDDMMSDCRKRGFFSPLNIRSTGIWFHDGELALNTGDSVYLGGKTYSYEELLDSKYAYEPGNHKIPLPTDGISCDEAGKLYEAISNLSWDKPEYAMILTGWITIAPFCAALKWRPHIWLSGKSGSGKTTVLDDVVKVMLSAFSFNVHGSTTEAGVRQWFGRKGLPLVFDEFETTDHKSGDRIQALVELFRQASFETDSILVKGSANGSSSQFATRFSAIVSAINVMLLNEADTNRFCVIELSSDADVQRQYIQREAKVKAMLAEITPEYALRYFSRTFKIWDSVRQSSKIINKLIRSRISGRCAQQYAPILAGYWHSRHDEVISKAFAEALIGDVLSTKTLNSDDDKYDSDEFECLRHIFATHIYVNGKINSNTSLGQLIGLTKTTINSEAISAARGYGVIINADGSIAIANKHPEISKLLRGTKWEKGYSMTLKRLPGAKNNDNKTMSFDGVKSKVTVLPGTLLEN